MPGSHPAPHSLAPGTIIGGAYRIERPLAEGGMGVVFVATHVATQRKRALKLMHAHRGHDPRLRERFVQEALIGSQIDSAHVVEVVDAGVDEATGALFIAMELLEGQDLFDLVCERGPMSLAEVLRVYEQLCHALGAAHQKNIVHRDLKPENLFLANSRQVDQGRVLKILDFGIAKIAAESRTWTSPTESIGTPMWMAPEQTEYGKPLGPTADIWALGLIAFFLLTGRPFWRAANATDITPVMILRELTMDPIPAASARAQELQGPPLPPRFDAWFARCVAREPAARFRSVDELLAGLRNVVLGQAAGTTMDAQLPAPPPAEPSLAMAKKPSRTGLWIAAVLVALAGVGTAMFFALRSTDAETREKADKDEEKDKKGKKKKKKKKSKKKDKGTKTDTAPDPIAPPHPKGPGPVYLSVRDTGLMMLDGGPPRLIKSMRYVPRSMTVGLDGKVWTAGTRSVLRLDGADVRPMGEERVNMVFGTGSAAATAVSFKGVHTLDGGTWSVTTPKADLGATLLKGIAIDSRGTFGRGLRTRDPRARGRHVDHRRRRKVGIDLTVSGSAGAGPRRQAVRVEQRRHPGQGWHLAEGARRSGILGR